MGRTEEYLAGCVVVITRPRQQARTLHDLVVAAGGEPWMLPTIETVVEHGDAVALSAAGQPGFERYVFVSRNAARFAAVVSPQLAQLLATREVYAVGEGTRAELARLGIRAETGTSPRGGSDALLALAAFHRRWLRGRRVLIVRGAGGREVLREALESRGASVAYAEVYRRCCPRRVSKALLQRWRRQVPDVIVISSGEALSNLMKMLPADLLEGVTGIPLVVMSKRILAMARAAGFSPRAVFTATETSDAGLMAALKRALKKSK